MAQTEDEKLQKDLFSELEKSDVKVSGEAAEKMKENIVSAREGGSYLGLGVHEVFIQSAELVKANSGTLGLRFNVESPDGKSDATFWLSEAALPYTIENVSRLVVHNTPEKDKDAARQYMANVVSAKEVVDIAKKKLIDGVAYLSIRESKTQTYTDKNTGEIKPSLERNLLSWRPKETPTQSVVKEMGGGTPVTTPGDLPF